MNPKPISKELDEEVRNVTAALMRAGQRARIIAAQTHTDIVIVRNGKLIKEVPVMQERR
jgi:hypothetical protein